MKINLFITFRICEHLRVWIETAEKATDNLPGKTSNHKPYRITICSIKLSPAFSFNLSIITCRIISNSFLRTGEVILM